MIFLCVFCQIQSQEKKKHLRKKLFEKETKVQFQRVDGQDMKEEEPEEQEEEDNDKY